jgi:tetratricopeptide (TPR) repeat protein
MRLAPTITKLPIGVAKISAQIVTVSFAILLTGCPAAIQKSRALERANHYFSAGEYDKAKIEYLNVLRRDGQNGMAIQRLGLIWLEQGVPFRAVPFLLRARELAPQNTPVRIKLALGLMGLAKTAEARKEALSILQRDPANSEAILILAEASQSKSEISDAEQQLNKFPQPNTPRFHLASASLAVRKGDLETALNEAQKALAADPKSAQAHLAMAYIYVWRKDVPRAGQEFKIAADLAPLRSAERIKYAEFQVGNGALGDAKASLQSLTKQAPDYLPAWRLLAQIAVIEKKYDQSLSLLENIFSRDPENPDVRLFQSDVLLAKDETDKAIAILDRLDTKFANNATVKYYLARAYLKKKNPAQATVALEQAVSANPNYAEAILTLGELRLAAGQPQPVAADMEALLKKRPDLWPARSLLARANQVLGRLDNAVAALREQIKLTPQLADAYLLMGIMLRQQEKSEEAHQAFAKAAELAPDNPASLNQLVEMDIDEKRYDTAMERVRQQLQKQPGMALAHFLEAKVYAAQEDWLHTEAALRKAIERDPNFAPAYNLLISVYLEENKLSEAISLLEAGLAKDPRNEEALTILAGVYDQTKDHAKARDTYEKLLAINPKSTTALNNLADIYSERFNRLDRAYELAQQAHSLEPADGSIADTLGWILYKRGDYQQALALLRESAAKMPDDPEIQFHLGMTNYMMGQQDAARAALEQAVRAPDFEGKAEAQRRLALLQGSNGRSSELSIAELETMQKQQPGDLIVVKTLAEAYEKQGDAAKAAAAYEQALKLNPKFVGAALKLAQLYAEPLQKRDKALEFAKKARELAPTDAEVAGVLGQVALESGNYSWAYSLLQESARQRRTDSMVLYNLGWAAYALGKVAEARQNMEHSLTAAPPASQSEDAKRFLAMVALDRLSADVLTAEPEVQKILKAQPSYVPALMAEGAIQLQRNDPKTAARIYLQVLTRYPEFAPAQKRLAGIYANTPEDLPKAYEFAVKARKTLPDDPEVARTLAEVSFKRQDFSYAIQLFEGSAAKQALAPNDLYYLGVAQLQTKQEAKGRETLARALAAGLQDPLAKDAKQRLPTQPPK